jgi:hypothetical protein
MTGELVAALVLLAVSWWVFIRVFWWAWAELLPLLKAVAYHWHP